MSYNKEQFIDKLRSVCHKLGIPEGLVVITHGGASLLFGYRETTADIDVAILPQKWEELSEMGIGEYINHPPLNENCPEVHILAIDGVDFHSMRDDKRYMAGSYLHASGFRVTYKQVLRANRIAMNRDKDQSDIEKIDRDWGDMQLQKTGWHIPR